MDVTERDWTRLGAVIRLASIEQERAAIFHRFPELRNGHAPSANGATASRRFSSAARRRMSAGMRKYWARRKAAARKSKAS
jgi:hypothetical protein